MTFNIPPQESALLNQQIEQYRQLSGRAIAEIVATRAFFVMRHAASGHLQYTYATPKGEARKYWRAGNRAARVHVAIHGARQGGKEIMGGMTRKTPRSVMLQAITLRARAADRSRAFIRAGWLGGMKALHARGNVRADFMASERAREMGVAQNYGGAMATAGERPMAEFWNSTGSYKPKVLRDIKGGGLRHDAAALKHGLPGLAKAMRHEEANLERHIREKLSGIARTHGRAGFGR